MKKLLNNLYVFREDLYLAREGESIVIREEGKIVARYPIHLFEGIYAFNYQGASPELMRLCMENGVFLAFFTPQGRLCGRVMGTTHGNVLLRRAQYAYADAQESLECVRAIVYAKIYNSIRILRRHAHDHSDLPDIPKITNAIAMMRCALDASKEANDKDSLRGIEGIAARDYFGVWDALILRNKESFDFRGRSKRPPMDRPNAVLSFLYSILSAETASALEGVGLDSYVGFFHTERPGRHSLALDLVEELRAFVVDRLVLREINLGSLTEKDFEIKENGATLLNDKGRRHILDAWNTRRHETIRHPFLEETVEIGLLPHIQAQLMARMLRGDLESYPPFLIKE